MQRPEPESLLLAAWVMSLIATLGSLTYSGIGFLGITGLGLPPCEMCWYQRILMYPLTGILAVAYLRRDGRVARLGLGFAVPGVVLALYHSLIQFLPHLELGQCTIGSCSAVLYRVAGFSIPNQSLIAFTGISACLGVFLWALRSTGEIPGDEEE